ncbi:MFS family permease [Actinoplanes octamycinicus]|uniref:MFS family permease n=1 Tax=Actinoplanes octamycinicus TaxID=135948 RepID=A0A7W7H4C0_9ACTN|nr:MFS transporter [Actinoplanes octamycinicus]MBB4743637.1 MFS family permease [Actinoplanes octamycinicus]GIE61062.1 MFS transporter [Actinoplanes octamycinicus]
MNLTATVTGRGLLPLLLLGNVAMYTVYLGIGGVLVPAQVAAIDPAHKVTSLGLVAGVSAVFATLVNPIAGALSDRTGRRNPWILGGGLAALGVFALLGHAGTVLLVAVGWCLGQAAMNVYQAALTAVVPDRVPASRRGAASAVVGLGVPIGGTLGVAVASATVGTPSTGYLILGVIVAGAALVFTRLAPERPAPVEGRHPGLGEQVRVFLSCLAHHDFRWAFIGRALLVLGYFTVSAYQLYLLTDHIRLPAGLSPAAAVAVLTPISMGAMALATVAGGVLSDRLGRRKIFIGISAGLAGLVMLIPLVSPTWTGMLLFGGLNGLAFGCFMAVDTALVTLVLPRAEDAARDLGVLNVANAGPQIIAPFVASVIVTTAGYGSLFLIGGALSVLGALAVIPVRSVR